MTSNKRQTQNRRPETPDPPPPSSRDPGQTKIPDELIDMIAQDLGQDEARATLGSLQATARRFRDLQAHETSTVFILPLGKENVGEALAKLRKAVNARERRSNVLMMIVQAVTRNLKLDVVNAVRRRAKDLLPNLVAAMSWDLVRVPKRGIPGIDAVLFELPTADTLRRIHSAIACVSVFASGKKGETTPYRPRTSIDLNIITRLALVTPTVPRVLSIPGDAPHFRHVTFRRQGGSLEYPMDMITSVVRRMVQHRDPVGDFKLKGYWGSWFREGGEMAETVVSPSHAEQIQRANVRLPIDAEPPSLACPRIHYMNLEVMVTCRGVHREDDALPTKAQVEERLGFAVADGPPAGVSWESSAREFVHLTFRFPGNVRPIATKSLPRAPVPIPRTRNFRLAEKILVQPATWVYAPTP